MASNLNFKLNDSTNWQRVLTSALNEAREETAQIITRTDTARKSRENRWNNKVMISAIATVACAILSQLSKFFGLIALGFGAWNGFLRFHDRSVKEINFTEKEKQDRNDAYEKIDELSNLTIILGTRTNLGIGEGCLGSSEYGFRSNVGPQFRQFLDRLISNGDTGVDDIHFSLTNLMKVYSIFQKIIMYRYLEENPPLDRLTKDALQSVGYSREQILEKFPHNDGDVYNSMAQQLINFEYTAKYHTLESVAAVCRRLAPNTSPIQFMREIRNNETYLIRA